MLLINSYGVKKINIVKKIKQYKKQIDGFQDTSPINRHMGAFALSLSVLSFCQNHSERR